MAVKNNLEVESLQDYEKMRQIGINASVGNVTGENKSYGGGVNYTGRDKNWVNEQTSLIGRNSVNVEVGNKLTIAGAKISNEENGIDKGNLIVKANEIETHDIVSKDNFLVLDANASITRRDIINKQKGNKDNNYVVEHYENDAGAGFAGSEVEKVSRATIGNGTIVTNQGTVGVNRDISKSDEKTRDVEVKRIGIDYNDERKGWGKGNQIISENAGTLGHFIDAANKKGNGFVDKYIGKPIVDAINRQIKDEDKKIHLTGSYENTFKESTYNTLRTVEDIIDKAGNGTVGLIPTSGMHGGIGEQIPKLFLEDEQKIYKLVVIIKNGEPSYKLKEVSRLDSKELLKTGEKVKVFNNGMNETLEKAAMNTAKQYAYGHGDGVYEMALVYNPTRGFLSDALETGLGKVFDGKNAPSLGVSRGFETALRTNDPNQDYELRSYSQGNIILKGGLNNMAKTNDTSLKNFDLSHTATPIMNKTFAEGSYLQSRLGYTNIGSIGNLEDGVTSEKTGMFFGKLTAGLASEMIDVNYDPNKYDSEREALKNGTKGHYTHEFTKKIPGLGEAMGNIEQTPLLKAPLFLEKNEKNMRKYGEDCVFIDDKTIIGIYRKQYPDDTKTNDSEVNKMRKILNKEFSRHRIYFDGDFGYKSKLDELEQAKNEALGVKEEDKEKGRKAYRDLIEEQKEINIQRQNNVIDILKTQRIPRADYDKDLVEERNNVLKEELKNTDSRNPSLERSGTEIQNLERKNNLQQNNNNNLEDVLKNLRERIGK